MNIYELSLARNKRKEQQLAPALNRMAQAILTGYNITADTNLAEVLNYDGNLSNEHSLIFFIREQVDPIDDVMAETIFTLVCDRFHQRFFNKDQSGAST